MTVPELLQRLSAMREFFPKEMPMGWSLSEYLISIKEQEERTLAGLDEWREQSVKMENEPL